MLNALKLFMVMILTSLSLLALGGISIAEPIQGTVMTDSLNRFQLIERTLDCAEKNKGATPVNWEDICYMNDSSDASGGANNQAIDKKAREWDSVIEDHQQRGNEISWDESGSRSSKNAKAASSKDKRQKSGRIAKNTSSTGSDSTPAIDATFKLSTGYRQDDFDWNIAGTSGGTDPNVLSELTWSELRMAQVKAKGGVVVKDMVVMEGSVSYADIYSGKNQDSDYLGDNRTLEFSRSNNRANDGEAWDVSGGAGLKFMIPDPPRFLGADEASIALLGGYSHHELDLIIIDGVQTIPDLGALPRELHSNYWAEWKGPWIGVEVGGIRNKLTALFRLEYHMADYYGWANWNLRDDFEHPKSYEHIADGHGFVFGAGLAYAFKNDWALDLNVDFQDWHTDPGLDRTFTTQYGVLETQLNEVNWMSSSLLLGASYSFF